MLQIHKTVVVICCAYPDWISDQGRNLTWDQFYHSLSPSLCDALGFTMAKLPEREQVNTALTPCTHLLRRSRHISLYGHIGAGLVPPIFTEISIGDTPRLQEGLPPLKMKSCSYLIQRFEMQNLLNLIRLRGSVSGWLRL